MIIVHCPDMLAARLPLQVIHKTWWQHFGYGSDPVDMTAVGSAQYDLSLDNRAELSTEQLSSLRQLVGTPSLVWTPTLATIPVDVRDQVFGQGKIVHLVSTEDERAIQQFVYWHKFDGNFVYSRANIDTIDFYQNMFQQLWIYVKEDTTSAANLTINSGDLINQSGYDSLLALVAQDRNLTVPSQDLTAWLAPLNIDLEILTDHPTELADFTSVWKEMTASSAYQYTDYESVLSSDGVIKFKSVIDYLAGLHS